MEERWRRAGAVLAALGTVGGAAAWFQPHVAGSDLWWHLAAGRQMVAEGGVPGVDAFSHTFAGQPWLNHEWLWGLLHWGLYALSPSLVAWATLAVLGAVFALVGWECWRLSQSLLATAAATWLAAASAHWFLDVRPHLLTLLFVALLVGTRRWRRAPWLWAPILFLWANLHSGFLFGLGLLGLWALVRSVVAHRAGRPLPRAEWIGFGVAALAPLLNPWGAHLYLYPLEFLEPASPYRELIEWRPPALSLDPRDYGGRFLWALALAALGMLRARRWPFLVALSGVAALMAFASRRFIPLFVVVAAPLMALALHALLQGLWGRLGAWAERLEAIEPRISALPWRSAALFLAAFVPWQGVCLTPGLLARWTQEEQQPAGAVLYLRALPQQPQRLLNEYSWGGYLSFHLPQVPVFIDGRASTLYDNSLLEDYTHLVEAEADWPALVERYRLDGALLRRHAPLVGALLGRRWRLAYADPHSVLLLPPSQTPPPALEVLLPEGPERDLAMGFAAHRRAGDLALASVRLGAVLEADPLQLSAYEELMAIAAARGDAASVARHVEEAVRAYPRAEASVWLRAAGAYRHLGARQALATALERGRPRGPFVSRALRDSLDRELEELRRGR